MIKYKIEELDVLTRIKEIRKDLGLSQENMAVMLGISQNAYYKIERGNTKLTLLRFFQISEILKIEAIELISGPKKEYRFEQYYTDPKIIRIDNGIERMG